MLNLTGQPSLIASDRFLQDAGMSARALDKALLANRIFAVELGGRLFFPGFYLDTRYDRRQLESVSKALSDLPGGSKLQFFTTPKGSLRGQTPLDAIANGDLAAVRNAARGFVER